MRRSHPRDERGQTSLLIIGFATILLLAVAVVVDASAAYLQRQGLATLADGAALHGADGGARGMETYTTGLADDRLAQAASGARAAVADYFRASDAYRRYPGLTYEVRADGERIVVRVRAPLDLPLSVPGSPGSTMIGAQGSAVVTIER
ncbi:pilus assembly protein TadG-related protein [Nocardioides pacificus]